jgi:uncharacterized membrane protein YdjX (TVP38/TMEM64 family)
MKMSRQMASPSSAARGRWGKKLVVLALVALVIVVALRRFGDALTFVNLAQQEAQLRAHRERHPVLVYGVAFLVYVAVTGLSLPGATVLTLVYGWYFGLVRGVLVVSFASTSGATVAFLLSRFLFRDVIQRRFGERLDRVNRVLQREGPFYLFTLRLVPAVPFFVINAVMGLTPIRTRTFWWVSQLGMLSGTVVYVYAGSSVPSLRTLAETGLGAVFTPAQLTRIMIALTLLGVFPWAIRWIVRRLSRSQPDRQAESAHKPAAAGDPTTESR